MIDAFERYAVAHGLGRWLALTLENVRIDVTGPLQEFAGTIAGWTGRPSRREKVVLICCPMAP